jgi:hypothetical protein
MSNIPKMGQANQALEMLEQGNWDQMDQMEHGRCPMAPST